MIFYLIGIALILLVSIYMNKISTKIGLPAVLAFILFGMFLGASGWINDFSVALDTSETLCSCSACFHYVLWRFRYELEGSEKDGSSFYSVIYRGSSIHRCYHRIVLSLRTSMPILESMLIGAVLSSTDAATVFSILRSRSLSLKYNTASIL